MGISAAWTDPTTLDLIVNQTLGQSFWENLVSNELYLYDLLTGSITDRNVSIAYRSTAGTSSAMGLHIKRNNSTTDWHGITFESGPTGDFCIYRQPNDDHLYFGNDTGTGLTARFILDTTGIASATIFSAGNYVVAANGIFSRTSFACLEGPDGTLRHVEILPPTGSVSVAAGGTTLQTLTFGRPFANKPAITALASIGGGSPHLSTTIGGWGGSAGNWTSVTVGFINHDSSSQTISDMCITAVGS